MWGDSDVRKVSMVLLHYFEHSNGFIFHEFSVWAPGWWVPGLKEGVKVCQAGGAGGGLQH